MGNTLRSTPQEDSTADHNAEEHGQRRTCISGMAVNLARNMSRTSAHKSMEAMHKVGSFVGVTKDDNHIDQWKKKFEKRVENGGVGFQVENLIPDMGNTDPVKQLEDTVAQVSAARHEQDHTIEQFNYTAVPERSNHKIISDTEQEEEDDPDHIPIPDQVVSQEDCVTMGENQDSYDRLPSVVYQKSKCEYLSSAVYPVDSNDNSKIRNRKGRENQYRISSEVTDREVSQDYGAVAYNAETSSVENFDQVTAGGSTVRFQEPSDSKGKSSTKDFLKSLFWFKKTNDDDEIQMDEITSSKPILKVACGYVPYVSRNVDDLGRKYSSSESNMTVNNQCSKSSDLYSKIAGKSATTNEPEYLYKADGLKHYQEFVTRERLQQRQRLENEKNKLENRIIQEQELLKETIEISKEEYEKTQSEQNMDQGPSKSRWRTFRSLVRKLGLNRKRNKLPAGSEGRLIQEQLDELPEYTPWFIYCISLIQVLSFLVLVSIGGVTIIGLEPKLELRHQTLTFRGLETLEHWQRKNIWIGPSDIFMIGAGAVFAPCMRDDIGIRTLYASYTSLHDGSMTLGCCEVALRVTAGTTTQAECDHETLGVGNWTSSLLCSERNAFYSPVPHVIKPCCYGIMGQCKMTSHEHCTLLEGTFYNERGGPEHCSQLSCMSTLCGFGGLEGETLHPYIPKKPNQWWRLLLPFIYNQGFIQIIITLCTQLIIGCPIERTAGHLRIAIIYIVSGIMALFFGSIMSPYSPQLGAGGAVFGLIGVLVVELIQSWKLIHRPWLEVLKLSVIITFFLLTGTLPFVDNFVLMSGFFYGVLLAICVLPYITFGDWHVYRRRILIIAIAPILVIMVVLQFIFFYVIQTSSDVCGKVCKYINCLPYTKLMCKTDELW